MPIPSRLLLATVVRSRKACARGGVHGCVRVHQGTEETISFVSEEKKVVEEIIMPTPVHSSRLVKTQPRRSYGDLPLEDLAQRYQES